MEQEYYKKFQYSIKKKYIVQYFPNLKDYAKENVYFYLLEDKKDGNRFIFISSKHYEKDTNILPDEFYFFRFEELENNFLLVKNKNEFSEIYFVAQTMKQKEEKSIFGESYNESKKEFIEDKNKIIVCLQNIFGTIANFTKFQKAHTKKIAIENPNWYIEFLANSKKNSITKTLLNELLSGNQYSPEILENAISTFMKFNNSDFSIFNDNFFILDEGKTGKTSLVSYMSEKLDELSMAGLYGSSDGKTGTFRGGVVTKTKKCIIVDELNELVKKKLGDKILPTLNTVLENGEYNYQKQFGAKIEISNQFGFLANIKEDFNFSIMLESCFGNTATLGRRIGVVVYNNNLGGFKKGNIRDKKPSKFLLAISMYMTNLFNSIFQNKKFIMKRLEHKKYKELDLKYKVECLKLESETENLIFRYFLTSHKEAIDRLFCRAVKNWIFKNLDALFSKNKILDNHSLFEILDLMNEIINKNLINLKNIKQHLNESTITSRKSEFNLDYFQKLKNTEKALIEFFFQNKEKINQDNYISYNTESLNKKQIIKKFVYDLKNNCVISKRIQKIMWEYGCSIILKPIKNEKELNFKFINRFLFIEKTQDLFKNCEIEKIDLTKKEEVLNQVT